VYTGRATPLWFDERVGLVCAADRAIVGSVRRGRAVATLSSGTVWVVRICARRGVALGFARPTVDVASRGPAATMSWPTNASRGPVERLVHPVERPCAVSVSASTSLRVLGASPKFPAKIPWPPPLAQTIGRPIAPLDRTFWLTVRPPCGVPLRCSGFTWRQSHRACRGPLRAVASARHMGSRCRAIAAHVTAQRQSGQ